MSKNGIDFSSSVAKNQEEQLPDVDLSHATYCQPKQTQLPSWIDSERPIIQTILSDHCIITEPNEGKPDQEEPNKPDNKKWDKEEPQSSRGPVKSKEMLIRGAVPVKVYAGYFGFFAGYFTTGAHWFTLIFLVVSDIQYLH